MLKYSNQDITLSHVFDFKANGIPKFYLEFGKPFICYGKDSYNCHRSHIEFRKNLPVYKYI